jgi:TRAP transporter TAXI family solute receptor
VRRPAIDKLVAENAFYRYATIPGAMYMGNPADIPTFGVGATFVASSKVSENTVYQVVKAVFDDFDAFKKLHPAFGGVIEAEMIKDALSAPLHAGAEKYYKERGWM